MYNLKTKVTLKISVLIRTASIQASNSNKNAVYAYASCTRYTYTHTYTDGQSQCRLQSTPYTDEMPSHTLPAPSKECLIVSWGIWFGYSPSSSSAGTVGLLEQISLPWSSNIFFSGLHSPNIYVQYHTNHHFSTNKQTTTYFLSNYTCSIPEHLGISHTAIDDDVHSTWHSFLLFSCLTFIASIHDPIVTSSLLNIRKLQSTRI